VVATSLDATAGSPVVAASPLVSHRTTKSDVVSASQRSIKLIVGGHGWTGSSVRIEVGRAGNRPLSSCLAQIAVSSDLVTCGQTGGTLDVGVVRATRFTVHAGPGPTERSSIHAVCVDVLRSPTLTLSHDVAIRSTILGNGGLFGQFVSDMSCIDRVDTSCDEKVLFLLDLGGVVRVLIGIGSLVFQDLDELVEAGCDNGPQNRSEPVDPVIAGELAVNDGRTE